MLVAGYVRQLDQPRRDAESPCKLAPSRRATPSPTEAVPSLTMEVRHQAHAVGEHGDQCRTGAGETRTAVRVRRERLRNARRRCRRSCTLEHANRSGASAPVGGAEWLVDQAFVDRQRLSRVFPARARPAGATGSGRPRCSEGHGLLPRQPVLAVAEQRLDACPRIALAQHGACGVAFDRPRADRFGRLAHAGVCGCRRQPLVVCAASKS